MKRNPAERGTFQLTSEEREGYSFQRALNYLLDPQTYGSKAGLELNLAGRALKEGATSHEGGMFIPFEAITRDLIAAVPSSGGSLVATKAVGFAPMLQESSVVLAAGATVLEGLDGNVMIPRQTDRTTAYWVAENFTPTESQPAFDSVPLSPKTVGGFTDVSRRLILQSSIGIVDMVKRDLMDVVGIALDRAAIAGTGAGNTPRGLLNSTGIGIVAGGVNGAAPTYDHTVLLESAVTQSPLAQRNLAFVTNGLVRGKLMRTQKFNSTNGQAVWERVDDRDFINGRKAFASAWVPSNLTKGTSAGVCSPITYGAWADLIIGIWGSGMTLMVDPFTQSTSGAVRLIVLLDCDVGLRYPTNFAVMPDALTT